jgi:hypothetical protein
MQRCNWGERSDKTCKTRLRPATVTTATNRPDNSTDKLIPLSSPLFLQRNVAAMPNALAKKGEPSFTKFPNLTVPAATPYAS